MYEKTAAALNRKGITVERESNTLSREYRVYTKDIPQPRLEFVPGEYVSGRNRNRERSIYLPEDAVLTFIDLLREVNKDFDYYGITTEYNREQTAVLINGLAERLNTMTNDKKFVFIKGNGAMDYYKKSNVDYRRYKRQIQKMYMDLIQWLKEMKEDKLNILGV